MIVELVVSSVNPDPNQPRKVFDEASIARLARSIKKRGLKQPITVRPDGKGGFFIIMGERRWRAHVYAGIETIRAIVQDAEQTVRERLADQLIENLQREDMNPIDTAQGFQGLLEDGWSIEEIAEELGYEPATIENKLKLIRLDARIQKHVASGQLGESIALRLTALSSEGQYVALRKIRGRSLARATPIIDALLAAERQVNLFAEPPQAREQKSLVKRYSMAMLSTIGFVRKITTKDYQILAHGLDDGRLSKRISEIELAIRGLRRVKRGLEMYQQAKKLRRVA